MANWYVTLDELKAELGLVNANEDARLRGVIYQVSRRIDRDTGRFFFEAVQTRVYTANCPSWVRVDDLQAVTSLKTDDGWDRTYSTTWATTDYELDEANAPYESPPEPYRKICATPNGTKSFPSVSRGVQVVGKFGYFEVLETLTTLAAALNNSATSITVPTGYAKVGQTWLVDAEQMFVSGVALEATNDTVTLDRGTSSQTGLNGTTRSSHLSGATVQVYTYPEISRACLIQAARLHKRGMAPLGVLGMPETGTAVWIGKMDPEARDIIVPFERRFVG
jgi:hypothetical protein